MLHKAKGAGKREKLLNQLRPLRQETIAVFRKFLTHSDLEERCWAADQLAEQGLQAAAAVPELTAALGDADMGVRVLSARALGRIGTGAGEALPELRKLLKDPEPRVRVEVARAVWVIFGESDPVLPVLVEGLHHASRWEALETLESMGPEAKAVVPELRKFQKEAKDPELRDQLSELLRKLERKPAGQAEMPTIRLSS
jgi:HEAT repeat protein